MIITEVLLYFAVLYKRYEAANSRAKAGRPFPAIATSSSHIADPANVSANDASPGLQAQIQVKIHWTGPPNQCVVFLSRLREAALSPAWQRSFHPG